MQVLYWPTEEECTDGLAMINANMRAMAAQAGYELTEDGAIIGKDASGVSQPDAQATETWDVVHHDEVIEEWWVADPAIRYEGEQLDQMMAGVEGYTRGEYEPPPTDDE